MNKVMKLLALNLLAIMLNTSAKVNLSAGISRGEIFSPGEHLMLELGQREMFYYDDTVYIEAELIEEKGDQVILQFTIATKNETGSYMVRGLPKLTFNFFPQSKITNGSLRCDGPGHAFTIVVNIERILETSLPAA